MRMVKTDNLMLSKLPPQTRKAGQRKIKTKNLAMASGP